MTSAQNRSIEDLWDPIPKSWNVNFRRLLKGEEILQFQALLGRIASFRVTSCADDRVWSLESSGKFTVRSLHRFSAASIPMDKSFQ